MSTVHDEEFSIIAVGASAGNQAALKEFFSEIPSEIQACFVVILHLFRDHRSEMTEIIKRFTPLKVVRATDGCSLRRGMVYVMPENVIMEVKNRTLRLRPRSSSAQNFAIDTFFSTMAQDFGTVNVAVVLSGMGTDGTQGALDMYRNGGHILVQDPDSTPYKSMPESVIKNDHPEVVAAPRELGVAVIRMVNEIYLDS